MTPGQARIALLSFLVVTTGVFVNAHFLQARPAIATTAAIEPAPPGSADRGRKPTTAPQADRINPRWPGATSGESPLRIARFAPDQARLDSVLDAPQELPSAKTVVALQRELTARGYGPLAGDGVMGLATRAGIMAFEHDHGLTLTGEASEGLLKRILLGGSPGIDPRAPVGAPGSAPGRTRSSAQAEPVIRTVQQGLAALGYLVGRIDGRLGEDTLKAIRDFEMDKGLVPKGRISAELVARLNEAAAPKLSGR